MDSDFVGAWHLHNNLLPDRGFTITQRTAMGTYMYMKESGDCPGGQLRPGKRRVTEAEERGCGCGGAVLWNRMRSKTEMRKSQRSE